MNLSRLRSCLLSMTLLMGLSVTPARATTPLLQVSRPEIASLTITLTDGRSYALASQDLQDAGGGAILWGDWAVANMLIPYAATRPIQGLTVPAVVRAWWGPGRNGELPPVMILTSKGLVSPLDVPTPGWPFKWFRRPSIASIEVSYLDGRTLSMSELVLRDEKSGILVWNDHAVQNLFVAFYSSNRGLATSPSEVLRIWNSPLQSNTRTLADASELPGFLVKPRCMPIYPGGE